MWLHVGRGVWNQARTPCLLIVVAKRPYVLYLRFTVNLSLFQCGVIELVGEWKWAGRALGTVLLHTKRSGTNEEEQVLWQLDSTSSTVVEQHSSQQHPMQLLLVSTSGKIGLTYCCSCMRCRVSLLFSCCAVVLCMRTGRTYTGRIWCSVHMSSDERWISGQYLAGNWIPFSPSVCDIVCLQMSVVHGSIVRRYGGRRWSFFFFFLRADHHRTCSSTVVLYTPAGHSLFSVVFCCRLLPNLTSS